MAVSVDAEVSTGDAGSAGGDFGGARDVSGDATDFVSMGDAEVFAGGDDSAGSAGGGPGKRSENPWVLMTRFAGSGGALDDPRGAGRPPTMLGDGWVAASFDGASSSILRSFEDQKFDFVICQEEVDLVRNVAFFRL